MSKVVFTAPRVASFKCPPGKAQAFLWDAQQPGLALRSTPGGKSAFVFQSRFNGASVRITIGGPDAWSIAQAREKAREFQRHIDDGRDPRQVQAETTAADVAARGAERASGLTVGEVWTAYLEERRPHWGDLHYRDHLAKAKPGGEASKARGAKNKKTKPGPLASLMPLKLKDLTPAMVEKWAKTEGKARPASARLAWRLLAVFLTWCSQQSQYAHLLPEQNPAKTRKARESLGKNGVKRDHLTREQLPAWFGQVRKIPNTQVRVFLQVLLLTGARVNELLGLRWTDINTQWRGIHIADKVEETGREIPLTPLVWSLINALPRRVTEDGEPVPWVFSSVTAADGRMSQPNTPHTRACTTAGLDGLTLHGLRRSFASLTEWTAIPVGVVAQIMGHKPSATAERHYKQRPLDLLRMHHERIEAWIAREAGLMTETREFYAPSVHAWLREIDGESPDQKPQLRAVAA